MIRFFTSQADAYNDWRWVWSGSWSPLTLGLLAITILFALWWSWSASQRLTSIRQKIALVSLRLLAAASLWFLLAGPAIELRHIQKIQNHLPVFLDTSASMRIQSQEGGASRLDAFKDFWKRHASLIEKLRQEQRLQLFTFDRTIQPLEQGIETLKADGDQTDLLQIQAYLSRHFQDKPLAGVVLVTDGVDTLARAERMVGGLAKKDTQQHDRLQTEQRLRSLIASLKRLQIPVHVIAPSPLRKLRDIAVVEVFGDAFAFLHNTATVEALIRVRGFSEGQIPIHLYREGQPLKSVMLTLQPDKEEYTVKFSFKPREAGKFIYSISTPVRQGEMIEENNRKDFLLKIIRDRIRVLHVTGRPSWDTRFLRRLLKKNANVDLISFFILRTHQNIMHHNPPNREMSLIQFPYHELFTKTLPTFDLVIFQDFNFAPYMSRMYLQNIANFVRGGGSFLMVGGDLSFCAGGYLGSPVESILPVELGLGKIDESSFLPRLTEAGLHHPITRLLPSIEENKALWSRFAPQEGCNLIGDLRPDALALLEHPKLQSPQGKPLPVMSVRQVAKGRTMALTTDGSWKWNFKHVSTGGTSEPYYRLWNNAIRWLIRDSELERVRVSSLRSAYRLGEEARFQITVLDRQYRPMREGKVKLQIREAFSPKILHEAMLDIPKEGGLFHAWKPRISGLYRIQAEAELEDKKVERGEEIIQVLGLLDEFQDIRPHEGFFSDLTQATQGRLIRFEQQINDLSFRPPTIVRVDRSKTVDLWDHTAILLFLFALFGLEWALRRFWGLP